MDRTPSISKRAAAALFLRRQHLDRPLGLSLTPASLTAFVEDAGGLQLDSINVVERAHYLTLWSRFGPYDKKRLDSWIYGRRLLFEYWAHAACLVPASHLGSWRRAMLDYEVRHTGWSAWLKRHPRLLRAVEGAVRSRGPLANADFERERGRPAGGWWSWKPETHALHYLWMKGRLAVHSREHFQKRYDLAERVYAGRGAEDVPSAAEFGRWRLRRALRALGAASAEDLAMYLTFPRVPSGERRAVLEALLRSGEVRALRVEGEKGAWYALREDVPELEGGVAAASRGTAFLSPFDSLLWHRGRLSALFGFDYKIEVYTPGPKRVHGYYSLPILHDGRLIGRLDPKNRREERLLEVRAVHFEPRLFSGREEALAGTAGALRSLAAFLGAKDVLLGKVVPAVLDAPLRKALREG